jgi:hypothetical protein
LCRSRSLEYDAARAPRERKISCFPEIAGLAGKRRTLIDQSRAPNLGAQRGALGEDAPLYRLERPKLGAQIAGEKYDEEISSEEPH